MPIAGVVIIEIMKIRKQQDDKIFFSVNSKITVRMRNTIRQIKAVFSMVSRSFGAVCSVLMRSVNDIGFPFVVLFNDVDESFECV